MPSFFVFFFSKSEREEEGFFSSFAFGEAAFSFFFKKERGKRASFLGFNIFGIEDWVDGEDAIEFLPVEVFSVLLLKKAFSPSPCF
jgi:hypothetical protein